MRFLGIPAALAASIPAAGALSRAPSNIASSVSCALLAQPAISVELSYTTAAADIGLQLDDPAAPEIVDKCMAGLLTRVR
jgi:hypothetical protein